MDAHIASCVDREADLRQAKTSLVAGAAGTILATVATIQGIKLGIPGGVISAAAVGYESVYIPRAKKAMGTGQQG